MLRNLARAALVVIVVTFSFSVSMATDISWDGSSSTSWGVGANWAGNAVPGAADIAVLVNLNSGNDTDLWLNGSRSIGGLRFQGSQAHSIRHGSPNPSVLTIF